MRDAALYTLDRELRLVSANAKTLALWGRSASEIIGKRLTELFPQVEGGQVHQALQNALKNLRPERLRTLSEAYGEPVEVEIFPVAEGLQVCFAPQLPG